VRLDVRVLDHLGRDALLEDDVGLAPALLDVAGADFQVRGQVRVAMNFDSFRLHCFQRIEQGGQRLVIDFDQPKGFLSGFPGVGGDGGNGIAVVANLLIDQQRLILMSEAEAVVRDILAGDDGPDASQLFGGGGVDL